MAVKAPMRFGVALARMAAALPVMAACAASAPVAAQAIAITFDDLPATFALPPGQTRVGVASAIIAALKAAHVPGAYGFVNGARIEVADTAALNARILPMWRAAGYALGSHTWSHQSLSSEGLAGFETEVSRVEPLLSRQKGEPGDGRWLRFPFLDEGNTPTLRAAARQCLAARGYHIASVTLSFADAAFNDPYARCRAKGDHAAVGDLENRFLRAADESLDNETRLSRSLFHRDIAYVLLLHFGAFDAHMLPRLLRHYAVRGVRFVTLPEAMRDPVYAADIDLRQASDAPVSLEAVAAQRGIVPAPNIWAPYAPYPGGALNGICR